MEHSLFLLGIIVTIGTIIALSIIFKQVKNSAWIQSESMIGMILLMLWSLGLLAGMWLMYALFADIITL